MYLGIDLGTSGVKAILLSESGQVVATHSEPLTLSRPHPLWSEQDPEQWWSATDNAILALAAIQDLSSVKALGLTGQMHGATLLGAHGEVLRPAILWNDGRSFKQCLALEEAVPESRHVTGNVMMPGFTAPKLAWVKQHEPEVFNQIDKVLLPKDYLRWRISGNFATDMSDAAGTLWLDVAKRDWSDVMLNACSLRRSQMPTLFEGCQITGNVSTELAERWGTGCIPVIAGGGDNAAGAVGVGLYRAGQAMLSLGTSGVYFAVSDGFLSNPQQAVHSFCHALPDTWHLMSVMLSAASCLDWAAKLTGMASVGDLLARVEQSTPSESPVWFLPYLSGERTPHNNPQAKGTLFGLTHEHGPADIGRAVLEGVGFALADGMDALHATGLKPDSIILIGGGARSGYWRQMLADISGQTLEYRTGGDVGPALGAARLAQIAMNPQQSFEVLLPALPLEQTHKPDAAKHHAYNERRKVFSELYQRLLPLMS
ncbi:xylulokinase [Hafnia psychrotolerans]|uniref:Xylulose kinase n=1 Tax=Hafnia psychrotolerans TaxID=1477018 RepID=A0ABQ1FZS9_9GAMM|nr:xylulokinase [Hafnia psychrotolerans]GGA34433.1 xylulokinase [Hafnia psychrotolerans]